MGLYKEFGLNRETPALLMFYSSQRNKLITLAEYHENMQPEQKIFIMPAGKVWSASTACPKPSFKGQRPEILYLTDDIDEFVIKILRVYEDMSSSRSPAGTRA